MISFACFLLFKEKICNILKTRVNFGKSNVIFKISNLKILKTVDIFLMPKFMFINQINRKVVMHVKKVKHCTAK